MSRANDITYDYAHVPTVRKFALDDSPIRSIIGPYGSGKSVGLGPIEIMRRAGRQEAHPDGIKRTRWAVIRNTQKQLEDTTIKTFMRWLPPNYFGEFTISNHNYKITAFKDMEMEIQFRALDRPDHVANLESWEITGAFINEGRNIPWALIGPLFGRCGRYPPKDGGVGATWHGLWIDSNAPPVNHWLQRIHERKNLSEHEMKLLQHWNTYNQPGGILANGELNPEAENLENLPDGYYETQASIMTEDQIKVYLRNEYGYLQRGKPVYPTWRDNFHKVAKLMPQSSDFKVIRGWDFGLTPACVLAYVAPSGQLRIFKEFVTNRAGIKDFAIKVKEWCATELPGYKYDDWGDPSGDAGRDTSDGSCFTILESLKIQIQGASNELMYRLESVRWGLNNLIDGEPAMVVDPQGCPVLLEGFQGGYHYRRVLVSAEERYSEAEPYKNEYSHPHDACQYLCEVVFGQMVEGNSGGMKADKVQTQQIIENDPHMPLIMDEDDWGLSDYDYDEPLQTEQIT